MKFYLSSYELGNETEKLKKFVLKGRIGYVPNARDFSGTDPERRERRNKNDGLEFVGFRFMPHWDSNHPESADIDKEIAYCKENKIPYKAIRDGEVLIIE